MPVMGLEPIRCCHQQILSLPRLPIPTHRLISLALTFKPEQMISYHKVLWIASTFFFIFLFLANKCIFTYNNRKPK